MKLLNKKTEEIGYFYFTNWNDPVLIIMDKDGVQLGKYNSLADLNEDWEDYKEQEEVWFVSNNGQIHEEDGHDRYRRERQSIGNYFGTREEAERAVEKLKAWKRVKDKGAEFYGWRRNQTGTYELYLRWEDRIPRSYEIKNDLDLLFGGEE